MKVKYDVTPTGRSPVEDFLLNLSKDLRSDFLDAVILLEDGRSISMPLSRNLSSIHKALSELRFKDRSGAYRFFYFIKKSDAIYFVHAFKKKTEDLPRKEIEIILKRLNEVSLWLGKK
jgi:phage-related protein